VLVGGHYRAPSNSVVGPFATEALRRTHASKAFIGVEGVSLTSGLTTPAAPEAEVAALMIEQTRGPVVVVTDRSKIGTVADFVIAPIDRVDTLVVDAGIAPEYVEDLSAAGVEVVLAGGPSIVAPDDG
jgi:DeoR family fructose operon transcriptional repressor